MVVWKLLRREVPSLLERRAGRQSLPAVAVHWARPGEAPGVAIVLPPNTDVADLGMHEAVPWFPVDGWRAAPPEWCPDSLRIQLTGLIDLAAVRPDASGVNQRIHLNNAGVSLAP
jgi:hypothetical protein